MAPRKENLLSFHIRPACADDTAAIIALLPNLADFELPPSRNEDELWHSDKALLERWLAGNARQTFVLVAVDSSESVLGVAITTLCEELLNHEPSAHLEVLVVSAQAHRQGIGKTLIAQSEAQAQTQGAKSMSLHVFANNARARSLYEKCGFDGELMRYYKPLQTKTQTKTDTDNA